MSAGAVLRAATRPRWWEPLPWLLALLVPALWPRHSLLVNEIAIAALFVLSLDLVVGYAGIVSLGHAAFFGFGAYAAGLLCLHVTPDPVTGLLLATAATALFGAVCSLAVRRGSDLTRLMVTLGCALLLAEGANRMARWTGGANGLQGMAPGPVLGLFDFDLYGRTAAWYSVGVALLLFLPLRRLVASPFGVSLQALRDNPRRAAALGIPVDARLSAVYTLAAAVAGAAGALQAQTSGFVALDALSFDRSAGALLMLLVGGAGWLWGGVAGAVVLTLLHDGLAALSPRYWMFGMGLVLVLLTLVGHERLGRLARPWRRKRGP